MGILNDMSLYPIDVVIKFDQCNVIEDSDLYFRIQDILSMILLHVHSKDTEEYLRRLLKAELEKELLTNVDILDVKYWLNLNLDYTVGILLRLDQSYIDNHDNSNILKLALDCSQDIRTT
jgi:hypothetical protein